MTNFESTRTDRLSLGDRVAVQEFSGRYGSGLWAPTPSKVGKRHLISTVTSVTDLEVEFTTPDSRVIRLAVDSKIRVARMREDN